MGINLKSQIATSSLLQGYR